MAEILSVVAGPIVQKVVDVAASFIKSQIDLLQHLKGDVVKLKDKLTMIQNVLKDAEDKQTGSHQLRDWLEKLEKAAYDAEDLLEMFETEALLLQKKKQARTLPLSFRETSWKASAAKKIKNLLLRLEDIARGKNEFGLENIHADVPFYDRRTTYFVNETDVVGREEDMKRIIDMLLSEELNSNGGISVIPIIGMGGMGKTTLAQLIYNNGTIQSHFKVLMWACVSNKFDIKSILKEMIETHSKMKVAELDVLSLNLIESRLLDVISINRIMVVLDDVWSVNYDEWEKLERLLKRAGKGSRVLITSRDSGVFSLNSSQTLYHLGRLPEDQCRSLFEKIAFIESNSSGSVRGNLQSIGWEIVQKCEGLPLAVKAVGGLLRGNTDVYKWKKIRDNPIWMAEKPQTRVQKATILPALKLSYDDLPSHIKKCFAYCYIYPKAYMFDKAELIKLWKGASLIPSTLTSSSIDETGSDSFDILSRMSFFELHRVHGKVQYKMHDLIHDLAQSVSSPHFQQIQDNKSGDIYEGCLHVSLLCEQVEQPLQNIIDKSVKLRTLLAPTDNLKNFGQSLDKLFRTVKYLRVLDLSKSTMLELPKSVGELKLLRYLNVSETEIRGLPDTICSLYHLQTLKLLRCLWLLELPKKLGNMAKLQHLELDAMFWNKCYTLPPNIGSLTSLENLHAFPINPDIGCDISELKNMNFLTGRLHISKLENAKNTRGAELMNKEKIEELDLEWTSQGQQADEAHENTLQYLEPHPNLESLKIYNYRGARFPSWIRGGILTNLGSLSLVNCRNCKVISLSDLPHLGEINMKGLLQLEQWTEAQYNSLGRLQISNCPKLRELPQQFNNLRVLKIKKCASLRSLPRSPLLMFLILSDNSELEDWNGEPLPVHTVNDQRQHTLSELPSILSVLEMKIENCPKMPLLPLLFAPQKLEIISCPLLTTLPIPQFSRRLQHLAIVKCADETLVNAIPETSSLYSLVISNISSLRSLPQLPNLPGLKSLHIHYCEELVSLSYTSLLELTALTYLSIRGCSKLITMVDTELPKSLEVLSIDSCNALKSLGSDDLLKNLASLKNLDIEDCQDLLSLPEGGLPSSLQHLRIKGCPLLLEECQENAGKYWPLIMQIPYLEIQL